MEKVAVVTGVTGQDGSYLADLLLEKGYKVYGMKRRTSRNDLGCAAHLEGKIEVVEGDLSDLPSILRLIKAARPHEVYNLAAQSHVGTSFEQPVYTAEATALGVLNVLEAIRISGLHAKFFQASTSELFGGVSGEPMGENTPFNPRSPYAVAKLYGYWITRNYRDSYRMFTCQAVCFNHESPRRGPGFVTRKITKAIARIKAGKQDHVSLGNLEAKRDWGHAKDYVRAMWMMMQAPVGEDYVVATGVTRSVRDFCKLAFDFAGLEHFSKYVKVDPSLYRPAEVNVLLGDYTKIKHDLGWRPEIRFDELVREMVESDLMAEGVPFGEPAVEQDTMNFGSREPIFHHPV
jgi:GDPmannose 4,6-dehydratase